MKVDNANEPGNWTEIEEKGNKDMRKKKRIFYIRRVFYFIEKTHLQPIYIRVQL